MIAEQFATIAAGFWAGISIYIALVEHPSALRLGVKFATDYFRIMSKRTAPLMMVLAAAGGVAAVYAWYQGGDQGWLIGGTLLLLQFPLTALFIVPSNIRLLKIDVDQARDESLTLHYKWRTMHSVRTLLGCPPFLIFVWLL